MILLQLFLNLVEIQLAQRYHEESRYMTTMNQRKKDTKKETDPNFSKVHVSCSRQWTNTKNPRIVRVSRAFGGKDRHSKVCTVRGLRDRRIRLSVPTAIQLYELQNRLGLSQPSKVIDWLLEAAKDDIDKLPPLPMLPQFQDPTLLASNSNNTMSHLLQPYANDVKEQGNQDQGFVAQNSFQNMPYSNPYNFQYWDPPNLSLSRFGEGYSYQVDQTGQDPHHHHLSMASSSHLYLAPSGSDMIIPSQLLIPSAYNMTQTAENVHDMRSQIYNQSVTPTTLNFINSPTRLRTAQSPEKGNRNL